MNSSIVAHSHGFWGPGEYAIAIGVLLLVGCVAIGGILIARALMRRASAGTRPCPGCGTFLAPFEECPRCPRKRNNQ